MTPKEKADHLISEFTSYCMYSYHLGGGKGGCACEECESDKMRSLFEIGREAAEKCVLEILDSIPAVVQNTEHPHIYEPSDNIVFWQSVLYEITKQKK